MVGFRDILKCWKKNWRPHLNCKKPSLHTFFVLEAGGVCWTGDMWTYQIQTLLILRVHALSLEGKNSAYIEGFLELKWGLPFFFSMLEHLWGASDTYHLEIDISHWTWSKGSQFSPGFLSLTLMKFGTHKLQIYLNTFCKTLESKAKRGSEVSRSLNPFGKHSTSADSISRHKNPEIKIFVWYHNEALTWSKDNARTLRGRCKDVADAIMTGATMFAPCASGPNFF